LITILFWNLDKKSQVLSHVPCLAQAHAPDIFILAECPNNLSPSITALNKLNLGTFREEANARAKVRALTRLDQGAFRHKLTSLGREMAVWSIRAPKLSPPEALVAGVHMPSKAGGNTEADQLSVAIEVSKELVDIEDEHNHRNTLVIGDFNMQPYDEGMTMVTGFHGLMTKSLSHLPDRKHRQQLRRRFYNPTWGLFGDRTPGPAGSFYWHSSVLHNTHWELLDQVLVRPALIEHLHDLRILDRDGNHSLVGPEGGPDRDYLSDHLPILARIDL
jgi:hypothetical protein